MSGLGWIKETASQARAGFEAGLKPRIRAPWDGSPHTVEDLVAAGEAVFPLSGLRWKRVTNEEAPDTIDHDVRKRQRFEFYEPGGALSHIVEFRVTGWNEGPLYGYLWGRSGKIEDRNGAVILEDWGLTDTYAKPIEHPLNVLHDRVWDKESSESV